MSVVVDIQGFKTEDNEFILKEFAIANKNNIQVFLFKPPCAYYDLSKSEKSQVNWIERNRNVYWREGFLPYKEICNIIKPLLSDKRIYVKGQEKVMWLRKITDNDDILNLEFYYCPSLRDLYTKYLTNDIYTCMYHSNVCALKNVLVLKKWCDNEI